MAKIDLHCHSIYSEHPSEWFLQRLGAKESYTIPEVLYRNAIASGMDYITITDHNKIDGVMLLKERYPSKVITGVEATAYFPEDYCKTHVLIYGLNDIQFEVIDHLRKDIYELRDYLRQERLAHSIAHASYSVNGKLNRTHLEKLILLFDYFEHLNGGRTINCNQGWKEILDNLSPQIIGDLYSRYKIEPYSDEAWIKGYTGGSDDHAELFIGKTWTELQVNNIDEIPQQILAKKTTAQGRSNTYHALAFTVYKIAWSFSKQSNGKQKDSLINKITDSIFNNDSLDLKDRLKLKTIKSMADIKGDSLKRSLTELIESVNSPNPISNDDKLDIVYEKISRLTDAYLVTLLDSLESDLKELNLIKIIRNISSSLPGVFILLPFFSTLKHINQDKNLLPELKHSLNIKTELRPNRILWFTDTLSDLNGVSVTIKRMGKLALQEGRGVVVTASLDGDQITDETPANLMNLPYMFKFSLPFYENYRIKIPSILKSLKMIQDFNPDKIIISTPGPLGLLALLIAKITNTPCIGIYHTDFVAEAKHIIEDESAHKLVLTYEKWFYNQLDQIRTPTYEYATILRSRDITVKDICLFRRGIETDLFRPLPNRKHGLPEKLHDSSSITLLYTGRVSQDKSMQLLTQIYLRLNKTHPDLGLIISGNGPYLSEMQEELAGCKRVVFTGALKRNQLPMLYNAADYFIFPSTTDTFGMVILESLACGLPVIVSNQGGPKELVVEHENGYVVIDQRIDSWVATLEHCIDFYHNYQEEYLKMRSKCSLSAIVNGNWSDVLQDLFGDREI